MKSLVDFISEPITEAVNNKIILPNYKNYKTLDDYYYAVLKKYKITEDEWESMMNLYYGSESNLTSGEIEDLITISSYNGEKPGIPLYMGMSKKDYNSILKNGVILGKDVLVMYENNNLHSQEIIKVIPTVNMFNLSGLLVPYFKNCIKIDPVEADSFDMKYYIKSDLKMWFTGNDYKFKEVSDHVFELVDIL